MPETMATVEQLRPLAARFKSGAERWRNISRTQTTGADTNEAKRVYRMMLAFVAFVAAGRTHERLSVEFLKEQDRTPAALLIDKIAARFPGGTIPGYVER